MLLLTAILLLTAMPVSTTPNPEEGIQKVLDDIYLGVSHQAKMDPDWAAFERAFLPQATLVLPYQPGSDPKVETLQEFIDGYREALKNPLVKDQGFFERCAGFEVTIFGNVATVVSVYEARTVETQETPDRVGLDMVQMIKTSQGWKAVSLITDFEREGNPLPPSLAAMRKPMQETAVKDSFSAQLKNLSVAGGNWREFLTREKLRAGVYRLAVGAEDGQSPHEEDEVYYVVSGKGSFTSGEKHMEVQAGDVIFVPAMEVHRFYDIRKDLELLVFFVRKQKS